MYFSMNSRAETEAADTILINCTPIRQEERGEEQ